jgi:hypothetical protein
VACQILSLLANCITLINACILYCTEITVSGIGGLGLGLGLRGMNVADFRRIFHWLHFKHNSLFMIVHSSLPHHHTPHSTLSFSMPFGLCIMSSMQRMLLLLLVGFVVLSVVQCQHADPYDDAHHLVLLGGRYRLSFLVVNDTVSVRIGVEQHCR